MRIGWNSLRPALSTFNTSRRRKSCVGPTRDPRPASPPPHPTARKSQHHLPDPAQGPVLQSHRKKPPTSKNIATKPPADLATPLRAFFPNVPGNTKTENPSTVLGFVVIFCSSRREVAKKTGGRETGGRSWVGTSRERKWACRDRMWIWSRMWTRIRARPENEKSGRTKKTKSDPPPFLGLFFSSLFCFFPT
jgi:hypothetical protein